MWSWPRTAATALSATLAALAPAQGAQELARAYREAQDLDARGAAPELVQRAYRRVLQIYEKLPPGAAASWRVVAGYAAYRCGASERARRLFEEAFERDPRDAYVAEWRLRTELLGGSPERAVELARAMERTRPEVVTRVLKDDRGGRLIRGADALLRRGRTELGLWALRRLAAAWDDAPVLLGDLALALRRLGRVEEAETLYRRALAASPDDRLLWNDLGLLYKGLQRWKEAEAAFAESVRREGARPVGSAVTNLVAMDRGADRRVLGDPVEALRRVLRSRPDAAMAQRLLLDLLVGKAASKPDMKPRRR